MLLTPHHRSLLSSPTWRTVVRLKSLPDDICPYTVLGIHKGANRVEIRAAYIQKMKDIHPDLNQGETTQSATTVNLAYEILCSQTPSLPDVSGWNSKDVFDEVGHPEILFVNPFRCSNVNPLEWRALQAVARSEANPEMALLKNGIAFSDGAIIYLTSDQMDIIEQEMERLNQTLDFEFCSWILDDALLRARLTNGIFNR